MVSGSPCLQLGTDHCTLSKQSITASHTLLKYHLLSLQAANLATNVDDIEVIQVKHRIPWCASD